MWASLLGELRKVTGTPFRSDRSTWGTSGQVHTGSGICHQTPFCMAQRLSSKDIVQQTVLPHIRAHLKQGRTGLRWAEQRSFHKGSPPDTIIQPAARQGTAGHLGFFGALGPSCPQAALGRDIFPRPLGKSSIESTYHCGPCKANSRRAYWQRI